MSLRRRILADSSATPTSARHEAWWAVFAGLAAFALYVRTLLPGLGGPEDTPKFQYLGYVLGTAHPPGYPLHTILTWAFSHVPLGTIAYRMNLFSAVSAAAAVSGTWLVARALGASRLSATVAALGLACGASFWWNAVMAEVYALAAALLAFAVWFTLRWARNRRPRDLYAAVACASLAAGNHLTIGAVAPALIVFVLVVDWRAALRPRTLLVNALIVCLGLCQYLYILVRTRQHALDLEAHASNLTELLAVIRAQRFEDQMFRFGLHALITERVPAVWWEVLHEFGWSGTALIVAGLVLLFRQRPRDAVLMLLGLVGAVALALNVAADLKGFLIPVFVLAWPAAALALDAARENIDRWSRTAGSALVATAGIALVGGLLHTNIESADRHRDTYFATYFDALFRLLPERTAFVAEDYTTDCMVHYQLIMSGRSRRVLLEALRSEPEIITALLRDGYRVMAFRTGVGQLSRWGFAFHPVTLTAGSLASALADRHRVVVVAAVGTALPADLLSAGIRPPLGGFFTASQRRHHVAIVAGGDGGRSIVESRHDGFEVSRAAGDAIGSSGRVVPTDVRVVAGTDAASVTVHGRTVASAEPGVAMAVLDEGGAVVAAGSFPPDAVIALPLDMTQKPLFEVQPRTPCGQIGDRAWHDVTRYASGGVLRAFVDNFNPAVGELRLYMASGEPLRPTVRAMWSTPSPDVSMRTFDTRSADDRAALDRALAQDAVTAALDPSAPFVTRVQLDVDDRGESATSEIALGGHAQQVLAWGRADRLAAARVGVCQAELEPILDRWVPGRGDVSLGPAGRSYFGAGWYGSQRASSDALPFRWTAARHASLSLPLDGPQTLAVRVRARALAGVARASLSVNGISQGSQPVSQAEQELTWDVPASAWTAGLNTVSFETDALPVAPEGDPDRRPRGLQVTRIRVERRQ